MEDFYKSIAEVSEGLFKDRGSKFFAIALELASEDDVSEQLIKSKKKHPKARHHCYAFRLGENGEISRSNDDGEPSGTAGKPIMGQLIKYDLTNTLVIVVRYFGGTKLGVSGLIQAYKSAAAEALEKAKTKETMIASRYRITMDYAIGSKIHDEVANLGAAILEQTFGEKVEVLIAVPKSKAESIILQLLHKLTSLDFAAVEGYVENTTMEVIKVVE